MWWEAEASGPDELAGIIGKGWCCTAASMKPSAIASTTTEGRTQVVRHQRHHHRADVTTLPASDQPTEISVRGLPLGRGLMTQTRVGEAASPSSSPALLPCEPLSGV